ncbi:CBS domain-containing protein [Pseudooceanicola sp. C21-150M6]|uniref:CBS domain-containing protein n=1 Tax=Pseudooceanicola sp. C21-150M6 TaxID=3434355 RepID=UPI003D7F513E
MSHLKVTDLLGDLPETSLSPETSVRDACLLMERVGRKALPVMVDGWLVGVVAREDIARVVLQRRRDTATIPVSRIMSLSPIYLRGSTPVDVACAHMFDGGFRHLVVIDGGQVSGVLSLDDIPDSVRQMARAADAA